MKHSNFFHTISQLNSLTQSMFVGDYFREDEFNRLSPHQKYEVEGLLHDAADDLKAAANSTTFYLSAAEEKRRPE